MKRCGQRGIHNITVETDFLNCPQVFLIQKFSGYAEFIDLSGFLQSHSYHKSVIENMGEGINVYIEKLPRKKEHRLKLWGEVNRAPLSQIKVPVIEREGWTENHRKFEGNKTPEDTDTKPRLVLHSKSHYFLFSSSRHSAAALTESILLHVLTIQLLNFQLFFLYGYSISLSICVSKQRKAHFPECALHHVWEWIPGKLWASQWSSFIQTNMRLLTEQVQQITPLTIWMQGKNCSELCERFQRMN